MARERALAGLPQGPLHGVPFLLKDLYLLYTGQPMSNGSRIYEDYVPDHDHEMTTRYKAAGLSIFGRSTSPEFGITSTTESLVHGKTHNPWNLEHTAGGSSGGAAAAVAAGNPAGRQRLRRRRLDPHPRLLLRAVRPETHPRAHAVGPRCG